MRWIGRITFAALGVLAAANIIAAFTAANAVPATRLGSVTSSIGAAELKPSQCSGVAVTTTIGGTGTFSGGSGSELILGSTARDTISAAGGNDCIMGGSQADTIDGGSGTDVCLGGPGNDTFQACETQVQ